MDSTLRVTLIPTRTLQMGGHMEWLGRETVYRPIPPGTMAMGCVGEKNVSIYTAAGVIDT